MAFPVNQRVDHEIGVVLSTASERYAQALIEIQFDLFVHSNIEDKEARKKELKEQSTNIANEPHLLWNGAISVFKQNVAHMTGSYQALSFYLYAANDRNRAMGAELLRVGQEEHNLQEVELYREVTSSFIRDFYEQYSRRPKSTQNIYKGWTEIIDLYRLNDMSIWSISFATRFQMYIESVAMAKFCNGIGQLTRRSALKMFGSYILLLPSALSRQEPNPTSQERNKKFELFLDQQRFQPDIDDLPGWQK